METLLIQNHLTTPYSLGYALFANHTDAEMPSYFALKQMLERQQALN